MEQLTTGEWAKEQLKRAPSFAIAAAVMTAFLIISTFIEYSEARPERPLAAVAADIVEEEPDPLDEIDDVIDPAEHEFKPIEDVPVVDADAVPVDAPLDDVTVDVDFTEDLMSDETEPTDPFPIEFTKKMAVIGSEPGTGGFRGSLGSRTPGGKRRAARRFGMPRGTDKDILAALRWLKKVQEPDGSWNCAKWGGGANADAGVTGLALLAFLGFGCTDKHPTEFAPTVRKAVDYLLKKQKLSGGDQGPNKGWFGERMYTQGICTMALAEAHGMRISRPKTRQAAQDAIDYIARIQPEGGGFGYTAGGNDTSVTGFNLQAIKAALNVGLSVSPDTLAKCERFLRRCLNADYSTSYQAGQGAGIPSMTAASLTGRLFLGHKRTARDCTGQAQWLTANNKHVQIAQQANNVYTIYYMSLSMFNMGRNYWKTWNKAFNAPLRARQEKKGPDKGSWPNAGFVYGGHGGRVYTTAMAVLSLEVYFRYERVDSPGYNK